MMHRKLYGIHYRRTVRNRRMKFMSKNKSKICKNFLLNIMIQESYKLLYQHNTSKGKCLDNQKRRRMR